MRELFPQPVNKIRFPGLINSAGRALVCGQEQGCSYVFRGCSSVPFSVVKGCVCVSPCTCADECGHQQTASGVQLRCNSPFAVLKKMSSLLARSLQASSSRGQSSPPQNEAYSTHPPYLAFLNVGSADGTQILMLARQITCHGAAPQSSPLFVLQLLHRL